LTSVVTQIPVYASVNLGTPATVTTLPSFSFPESISANNDSYFVSMIANSEIRKYDQSWGQDTSWSLSITSPGGMVMNSAGTKLWARSSGVGVMQYSVSGSTNSLDRNFSTSQLGFSAPNGLCLDATERYLYVTDPGISFGFRRAGAGSGVAVVNGLAEIDLQTGTVKQIFNNRTGVSPNGCSVMDGIVYIAQSQDGIGTYNPSTGEIVNTLPISTNLKAVMRSTGHGGDGMVAYKGLLFVSSSTYIYQCTAASSQQCVQVSDSCGADMQLVSSSDGSNSLIMACLLTSVVTQIPVYFVNTYTLSVSMTLGGVSTSEFLESAVQTAYKSTVVAAFAGTSNAITAGDITITSPTRRDTSVSMSIDTGSTSSSSASSMQSTLGANVNSGAFASTFNTNAPNGVSTTGVSGLSSSVSDGSSSNNSYSGFGYGQIAGIAGGICFGVLMLAFLAYGLTGNTKKSDSEKSDSHDDAGTVDHVTQL